MFDRRGKAARAGAVSLTVAAPLALLALTTGPAHAADGGVWDRLAQCESGGNWQINTGNGYYGGLQFSASTWAAYGGSAYAATADQATRAQQIEIAGKVQNAQGWGAWPACSAKLGLYGTDPGATQSSGSGAPAKQPAPQKSAPQQPAQPAQPSAPSQSVGGSEARERTAEPRANRSHPRATYTVKAGDTLSRIAEAHGADWRQVYEANADVIGGDPDLIVPGQGLKV
ncbi:LysM peptidoglycan-binding domain-containing protein [Streptomyces sp. JJ66]|uniref:LysM peptidoglycan-binding domain-containing protein n=1 Tax=Streptomyces sp. JJ66 TaxID=2803843 RepID=UPI001C59D663|nr:transglycosylase family protein [Streptomyces sp. JJ66]MBW1602229.1 LysM peptidoglycan-binding domain-containing protein [Streptomyces sp. JJ66]